jgi:hypothetical protein
LVNVMKWKLKWSTIFEHYVFSERACVLTGRKCSCTAVFFPKRCLMWSKPWTLPIESTQIVQGLKCYWNNSFYKTHFINIWMRNNTTFPLECNCNEGCETWWFHDLKNMGVWKIAQLSNQTLKLWISTGLIICSLWECSPIINLDRLL